MGTAAGRNGYSFGRWRLLPDARRLLADGEPVALGSRAFDLLLVLVEDALLHRVWPSTVVEENNLQVQMSALRRALGVDAAQFIATVPGRGYRFTGEVRAASAETAFPGRSPPNAVAGRPMVVVLPFENIGGEPEEGYFSAGLTADLVTDLTRFESMHVVAPRRGADLPGALPPIRPEPQAESGAAARYLVSGAVRRSGGRIRVTARLEDADSGVHLWAERFDRPLDDLFAVQEELADRIAARRPVGP
jgi:TolB-like protein